MENAYEYFAFVSYSHRDERWAKFIQSKLEGYKLPNVIRKEAGRELPKWIRPIFRDATDLGAGMLEENLKKELAASRYLIVICSPNSARENAEGKCWVDNEVRYFAHELKRADRIIPIIIEGTPEVAFCKTLKELECLALDATKHQKARIVNDIVAKILELKPDDLWQRELRRTRCRRLVWGTVAFVASLFLAVGSYVAIDATRTHVKYFLSDRERWGIDHGESPVELDLVKTNLCYRFEYRGYRRERGKLCRCLRSVVCVDGEGHERCFPNVVRSIEYSPTQSYSRRSMRYDAEGRIAFVGMFSPQGKLRQLLCYEKGRLNRVRVRVFDESGNEQNPDLLTIYIEFDEQGKMTRSETCFSNGVRKVDFVDEEERLQKTEWFGLNKERTNCDGGWSICELQYDANGRERARYYYNENHRRCRFKPLGEVSGWTNVYDTVFSKASRCFLDVEDREVEVPSGYSRVDVRLDQNYRSTEKVFYNARGQTIGGNRIAYDEQGRVRESIDLDENLQPTQAKGQIAILRFEYDDQHRRERRRFFAANGAPYCSSEGYWGIEVQKDEVGNEIARTSLDPNGKPCLNKDGWSTERKVFDKQRRVVELWHENPKGEFVPMTVGGIASQLGPCVRVRMIYTQNSHVEQYEVLSGQRWRFLKTYHFVNGQVYRCEWLDENMNLVEGLKGYAYDTRKYNEYGELTEQAFFDSHGELVDAKGLGCAVFRCEYDHSDSGIKVEFHCLNAQRFHVNAIKTAMGNAAMMQIRYDTSFRPTSMVARDASGKALKFTTTTERIDVEYDGVGRITRLYAKNADGTSCPMVPKGNFSSASLEYSDKGDIVLAVTYDMDNHLVKKVDDPEKLLSLKQMLADLLSLCKIMRYRTNYLEVVPEEVEDMQQLTRKYER